ncbi:MAG: Bifunctional protein FolC, partial [Alphaproteobacteria bacterium MarineAlpha6_Bin4]
MNRQIKSTSFEKKNSKIENLEISLEKKLQQLHPKKIDLSLNRITKLLNKLGNPQKNIKNIIHIAGTNGKGSVLAFLKSLIKESGYTVNTYSSPHLINFNERINLNGKNITDKFLESLLDMCNKKNNGKPITFFEMTTVAAFLAFKKKPADYTILEVGLGGRLDATNIIKKPIISIINEISIDHTNFLGSNIQQIAGEKAGIIKKKIPVVVGKQKNKARKIIKDVASKLKAETFF